MKSSRSILIGLYLFVGVVNAGETRTFAPFVVIEGTGGQVIEIRADERMVSAVYSSSEQSFHPLSIPFQVVSVSGEPIDYQLSLVTSVHQCKREGGVSEIGVDVEVKLDGNAWPVNGSSFTGKRDEHTMNLTYGPVPQIDLSQSCFGTLRVQAEVGVI